jgi:hypothetical protein
MADDAPETQTRVISVRVTAKVGKQFEDAAAIEDMQVSAWLREVGVAASYDIIVAHRKKTANG